VHTDIMTAHCAEIEAPLRWMLRCETVVDGTLIEDEKALSGASRWQTLD
jgi:hypothetical protein